MDPRPSDLDPYPRSDRDLAALDLWEQSLERSRQRRRLFEASRRNRQRRRGTSMAVSAAMLASPIVPSLAGARGGAGRAATPAPVDTSSIAAATDGRTQLLSFGDTGDAVAAVQRQLTITADGIYGPITRASVAAFQREHGLSSTGAVDARTWSAMFNGRVLFYDRDERRADTADHSVKVVVRDDDDADTAEEPAETSSSSSKPEPEPEPAAPSDETVDPAPAPPAPAASGDGCTTGTASMPVKGTVTGRYGEGRGDHTHAGLDIAAPSGTPVHAAQCGTVTQSADKGDGYGLMVCVRHAGSVTTCYAHLSASKVASSDDVKAGQTIGNVGCSGSCTGPHVHVEVRRNGQAEDPGPYLSGQKSIAGATPAKASTATLVLDARGEHDVGRELDGRGDGDGRARGRAGSGTRERARPGARGRAGTRPRGRAGSRAGGARARARGRSGARAGRRGGSGARTRGRSGARA